MTELARVCRWDRWASRQVLETLQVSGGKPEKALAAFQHALATEVTWFERMGGNGAAFYGRWNDAGSLAQCERWFAQVSESLLRIAALLEEGYGSQRFAYQNSQGEPFESEVSEVLTHTFLHSAQYRGEAAGFLNEGVHRVPELDYIFWLRLGEPA